MTDHARKTMLLAGTVLTTLALCAPVLADDTELAPVTVSTEKAKVATDTAAAVSELDEEDIEEAQAENLTDLLKSIPGVSVAGTSSPTGQAINIRGFGSQGGTYGTDQRVVVSVDGTNQGGDELYRIGSMSFIDPELLKNVKVFRGPAGTGLYSSGAIGGAVIAETKDASDLLEADDTWMARQKLQYSSNGNAWLSSTYFAARPLENLELLGSFAYRNSDLHQDGDGNDIEGTDYGAPNGLISGKYTFGETGAHSVKATYQHNEGTQTNVPFSALSSTFTYFGNVDRDIVEDKANLEYAYSPTDNDLIDFKLNFGYRKSQVDQYNSTMPSIAYLTEADYTSEVYSFRGENTSRLTTGMFNHTLIYGLDGSLYDRTGDYDGAQVSSAPDGRSTKVGAFLQDKIEVGRLTLTPTMRVEYQSLEPLNGTSSGYAEESTNFAVAPSLEAVYALTNHLNVFGSIAYTDRLPTADELFATGVTDELEPETALNYEAGVSYDHQNFITDGDVFQTKISVYQNNIENMIDGGTQADEAKVEGVEVEARYDARRFYTAFSYAQIRGYDLTNQYGSSGWLPYIPADQARFTVGTRFPTWNLDVSWEAVFTAGQERVSSLSATSGYALHNFKTVWKPDHGVLEGTDVIFGVENIFDKSYTNYLSQEKGDGRTFKLTIAKTF